MSWSNLRIFAKAARWSVGMGLLNLPVECFRPATVGFDDLVDLLHDADGLEESDDDFLVVVDVVLRERAALPVLQPLVADVVAADVEVPDLLGDAAEADGAGINYATPRSAAALSGGSSSLDPKGWLIFANTFSVIVCWICSLV